MKIFLTGHTLLQANQVKVQDASKINVPMIIGHGLQRAGHEVTWGALTPGNELHTSYDAQIVCLAPAMSINAPFAPHGLWALAQELPTVLFWDDWQIRTAVSHHRGFARRREVQLNKRIGGSDLYPSLMKPVEDNYHHSILDAIQMAAFQVCGDQPAPDHWRAHMLPMYRWGDPSLPMRYLLAHRESVLGKIALPSLRIDPSSQLGLVPDDILEPMTAPDRKLREWCLASLMSHQDWVEEEARPTWPVRYYGSRKLCREGKALRLRTEASVQRAVAGYWGTLMPRYPHAGSGWFRARNLYCARGRSIIYGDPRDSELLGPGYHFPIEEIEAADDARLVEMAQAQADIFLPRIGTRETFMDEIDRLVRALS